MKYKCLRCGEESCIGLRYNETVVFLTGELWVTLYCPRIDCGAKMRAKYQLEHTEIIIPEPELEPEKKWWQFWK